MKKRFWHTSVLMLLSMIGFCSHAIAASNASITVSTTGTPVSGSGGIAVAFGDSAGHVYSETLPYGQYSSPASLASWLAARFTSSYLCPAVGNCTGGLGAHASGAVITFQLNSGASFGPLNINNSSSSFSFATSGFSSSIPLITWPTPAPIAPSTALSSTQLNATANVSGTFVYSPAAGTVLGAGSHTLSVTFTPNNTTLYSNTTATVQLVVNAPPATMTCWP